MAESAVRIAVGRDVTLRCVTGFTRIRITCHPANADGRISEISHKSTSEAFAGEKWIHRQLRAFPFPKATAPRVGACGGGNLES